LLGIESAPLSEDEDDEDEREQVGFNPGGSKRASSEGMTDDESGDSTENDLTRERWSASEVGLGPYADGAMRIAIVAIAE